jgi:predicted N-acyltransferase
MRRLSELITGWERPSRSSITQMLQFARRDSVYMARKKLAGLKDWALGQYNIYNIWNVSMAFSNFADLIAKLKSKQGMAIRREARATKLVATVMGKQLFWHLAIISFLQWLIYMNNRHSFLCTRELKKEPL